MKPGFAISKDDRMEFTSKGYCPTYGELTKKGVHKMLKNINVCNKVFVDMGSGTGNVVKYIWTVNGAWKRAVGIELSRERHEIALSCQKQMAINNRSRTLFVHGDLFSYNLQDADIIYISNLCFSENINRKIGKKVDVECRPGTIIFSSKLIYISMDHTLTSERVDQTWGKNSVLLKYTIV